MTLRVVTSLLLLLAPVAAAQDTFDLRRANDYKPVVGDKVRAESSERQTKHIVVKSGAQVVQDQSEVTGQVAVYTDEVLTVDDAGEVASARRTYESFRDQATDQDLQVAGLTVLLTRDAAGKHSFAAEGGATLPPALQQSLEAEAAKKDQDQAEEKEREDALLPEAPVAVGASWDVPPERVLQTFGFDPAANALDPKTTARGTLVKTEERDGQTLLTVKFELDLFFSTFQSLAFAEPASFDIDMELVLPADGTAPHGEAKVTGAFIGATNVPPQPGAPPMEVSIDIAIESKDARTPTKE